MGILQIDFGKGKWNQNDMIRAYSFRFTETPLWTQNEDGISSAVNPSHREGYDNISLLSPETYSAGAKASLHCSFEGTGCPEIILVEKTETCEDGAVRYGACFELVLYRNGLNVWRHFREDGRCFWHKRLGVVFPVAENAEHVLEVEVKENMLCIQVDGQQIDLRTEDLPERFHVGLTLCEGIARAGSFAVES